MNANFFKNVTKIVFIDLWFFTPLWKCSVDDMSGKSLWVTFCDVNEMAFRPLIEPVGFSWTNYKTECTSDIQKTFILYAGALVVCSSHHLHLKTRMCVITMSWELWKHPDPVPGGRPMFFKAESHKESKNGGSKHQLQALPSNVFFRKLFLAPKIIEKSDGFTSNKFP